MTLRDNLSPAFQALQGFHRFVPEGERIVEQLGQLYQQSLRDRRGFNCENRDSVRLLDTFFGFPRSLFREMVRDLTDRPDRFRVQILVVNPHSQLARSRAQALAESTPGEPSEPFFRSSRRLHELIHEVCVLTDSPNEPSFPDPNDSEPIKVFRDLLITFREVTEDLPIEIRFYDRPTEAPVYIVSEFIAKGLLIDNRGADRNPWMIIVDDPNQPGDLFDRLSRNFDDIWDKAAKRPTGYRVVRNTEDTTRSAFVIMPMEADDEHLESVYATIRDAWSAFGVDAMRADDHHTTERRITDVMMHALSKADYVLCDLSRDRPNVYYEAGYAQALGKPVMFIAEEGTDVHFDLRDYPITFYTDPPDLEVRLKPRIERLLEQRTLYFDQS